MKRSALSNGLQKERDLNPQPLALETKVLPIELSFLEQLIRNMLQH